jgi:transcriptional regulator with XRE-family HTH domain
MPNQEARMSNDNILFGHMIRDRRRQLELTQEELARRIQTSTPYIGHIESGKRHPSDEILTRIADVLGFDRRELFFVANPTTRAMLSPKPHPAEGSAWNEFRGDAQLHQLHQINPRELDMLSQVAMMGDVRSSRDFIYILNTIRQALVTSV